VSANTSHVVNDHVATPQAPEPAAPQSLHLMPGQQICMEPFIGEHTPGMSVEQESTSSSSSSETSPLLPTTTSSGNVGTGKHI
jgi:hypothetical protein